jgi:hypothetical protein
VEENSAGIRAAKAFEVLAGVAGWFLSTKGPSDLIDADPRLKDSPIGQSRHLLSARDHDTMNWLLYSQPELSGLSSSGQTPEEPILANK